jgi:hypothetical protein
MVRMTDLLRGRSAPARTLAPPAPPAEAGPETEAGPADVPRLSLRVLADSAPVPAVPALAAEVEPPPGPDPADELFADLVAVLERVRRVVAAGAALPWADLTRAVEDALVSLGASVELFWIANGATVPAGGDPVAVHQARVAVLALRVGANAGLDRARLLELGVAGALIDVGLWVLADSGRRADPASAEFRAHPRLGADTVRGFEPPADAIVEAILQHHELEQGQGFPQGLKGGAIHPYAKILALVDRYASLTGAAARGRTRAHDAIRDIVRSRNEEFSPPLIKALLSEISVFPPGTPVRLNTGEYARVIRVNRDHPLRPCVEVVADAKGRAVPAARVIDLAESPFVYITGPAAEQS